MQEQNINIINEQAEQIIDITPEIIGSSVTDVQINGDSIISDGIANLITNTPYNNLTNKIATMTDLDTKEDKINYTKVPYSSIAINLWDLSDGGYTFDNGQELKLFINNVYGDTHNNIVSLSNIITTDYLIKKSKIENEYTIIEFKIDRGGAKNIIGITLINDNENMGGYSINAVDTDIPTKVSDLTNDSGFITGITNNDVVTALEYTPESNSNKVLSISNSSTDTQYPSAKAVYDLFNNITDGDEVSF